MYRYVIFESQKANHDSKANQSSNVNFPLLHAYAPQAPRVVSRNAPFSPHMSTLHSTGPLRYLAVAMSSYQRLS